MTEISKDDLKLFPTRARRWLRPPLTDKVKAWEALTEMRESDFCRLKGIGPKTAREVAAVLASRGMAFKDEPISDRGPIMRAARLRPSDDEVRRRARIIVAEAIEAHVDGMMEKARSDPEGPRVEKALRRLLKAIA